MTFRLGNHVSVYVCLWQSRYVGNGVRIRSARLISIMLKSFPELSQLIWISRVIEWWRKYVKTAPSGKRGSPRKGSKSRGEYHEEFALV